MATAEGLEANSWIEKSQMAKLFYFQVFNIFLGSLLTGSIFTQLSNIIDDPASIASLLGTSLPSKATFFINYVMLLSTGFAMGLLRVGPLIVSWIKVKFLAKTPKEMEAAWAPSPTSFGVLYPEMLLVFCIGITYAPIAPFALAFCFLYMGFGYIAFKYQVLYVDIPVYQSGGYFFPSIFYRVIIALLIMQATLIGLFGVKASPLAVLLIPSPFITMVAFYFMDKWYIKPARYTPMLIAKGMDQNDCSVTGDSAMEQIDPHAYSKPCLHEGPIVPDRWDDDNRLVEKGSESTVISSFSGTGHVPLKTTIAGLEGHEGDDVAVTVVSDMREEGGEVQAKKGSK